MPQKKTTATTAAMTARNYTPPKNRRAGHGRHSGDRPTETSSILTSTKTGGDGDDKQRERDQGRRNREGQQTATRKFMSGEQHPAAASPLDRPINFAPFSSQHAAASYSKSQSGAGDQHATA